MRSVQLLAAALLSLAVLTPPSARSAEIGRVAVAPGVVGLPATTSFTLEIRGTDFIEALDGGGLDITYDDSILSLDAVDIAPFWDVGFPAPTTPSGSIDNLFFLTTATAPASFSVAFVHFTAIANGTSPVTLVASTTNPFAADGRAEAVTLSDGTVTVPEPGVVTSLLAGCTLLAGIGLRTRSASRSISTRPMSTGGDADATI
jgi:hypothetical protein